MDKREFKRVLDQVKPTAEQEQAMLDSLLTEQKEVKPMHCMKKMTAVMAAAALLLMACALTTGIFVQKGQTETNPMAAMEVMEPMEEPSYGQMMTRTTTSCLSCWSIIIQPAILIQTQQS